MKKIFTLFLFTLACLTGFGQRIITENFDYATGALTSAGGTNVSGGTWVTNTGTGNYLQVTAGNLGYTNYLTSPAAGSNKLSTVATGSSAEDTYRAFTTQTTGTVYASVLVKINDITTLLANTDANGDYLLAFLPSTSTSNYTSRISFRRGVAANTVNIGIRAHTNTTTSWAPADYAVGNTMLIVFSYQFVAGTANDIEKLWINPVYSAAEPAALATSDFTMGTGGTDAPDISRFGIRQGTTTPGADIDAIKVSTSWSDVSLPLSLLSFTGYANNNKINIEWSTTNEVGVATFAVDKSANGKEFSTIATVEAKNGFDNTYSVADEKPIPGINYYRLKWVNKDGSFKYSQVITVKTKAIGLDVYPNPVKSNITLQHAVANKGTVISVLDLNGKQVLSVKAVAGEMQTNIDATMLKPGSYVVVYDNNGVRFTKQFVKQ